jgi:hypothetical protein
MPQNLLRDTWTDLDRDELRLFLWERFGRSLGQYDGDDGKLYLPLAGAESQIALTFDGSKIKAVEAGQAFDAAEWDRVAQEIEEAILAGTPKTGRDYSFSTFPVLGSWRGRNSRLQILPAPDSAPRAAGASNPFILEFPIKGSDLWPITNHRRIREHRKLTLLLNLLLAGTTSSPLPRPGSFWALIPPDDGGVANPPDIRWVQEYYAALDQLVLDEPSPPAAEAIEEVEPEEYYASVGNDGRGLRVPIDLDEAISRYLDLSAEARAKFDRATFWLDMASRQSNISVSASFASFVSAIEALTERGVRHQIDCPVCGERTYHEVPGATRQFKGFLETYAPGAVLADRRGKMYALRSGILHGSDLIKIDHALAFGWDPPWLNQRELLWDLSSVARAALRNWLKSQAGRGSV